MNSDRIPSVVIHTSPAEAPSIPPWFAAAIVLARYFTLYGQQLVLIDVDDMRQAARQRAIPVSPDLPTARRRMHAMYAPGQTVRERGVVTTRPFA